MIKIGIYYAFWENNWDADFHPYIDKVADLGFDILEINSGTFANLSSAERKALRAHAVDRGIDLTYCIGLTAPYDIASEDAAVRKNGIQFLQAQAKAIGEVGGGKLSGIIYGAWPATLPGGETNKTPYLSRSIESMKEAVKAAEDHNVIFDVEVVNRFEQFLLNTCSEAVEYVRAVGSDHVRILLDTYHMNIEEDRIGWAIEEAGPLLDHIHIGENNRKPPGYGHIPWTELAGALRRIGYDKTMTMEPFVMPGGEVGRDIKVFRNLGDGLNLDAEAQKALWFIRGLLK
jgi:D-psicose/D-tagatose/L-ribulose 3-epimerase